MVGESRIKGIDDACFAIANYTMYRLDRDYPNNNNQNPISYANAGGLLVYVRNDVQVGDEWESRNNPDGLQYIRLSLNFNNQQICLVAVYNPPVGGNENAMVRVNQQGNPNGGLLYDLHNNQQLIQQKVVVLGDINVDIFNDANQNYRAAFGHNGVRFQQHVGEFTREGNGGVTLIDHIYSKIGGNYIAEAGVIPPGNNQLQGLGDHKLIYCTVV